MTDIAGIRQTWVALLLADRSPCLRQLVLQELLGRPGDDPEVVELTAQRPEDPLVKDLVAVQGENGAWQQTGSGYSGDEIAATAQALICLGYLGFGPGFPPVDRGAAYLFSLQRRDSAWPMSDGRRDTERYGNYQMIPLQTAIPLRALAACGYATDERAERAYDWLMAQRLPDGAWPTGVASGTFGRVAGYRRLAHSRWGCRSNTTGALMCLALHPRRRSDPEARRALDLLLGRESKDITGLGFEVARIIGAEPARGFLTYYATFDVAQLLDLCHRIGVSLEDERIAEMVAFVAGQQGPYGLWEYGRKPQASRWLSFDLLRSLSRLDRDTTWLSLEPRTPFQGYAKRYRRY